MEKVIKMVDPREDRDRAVECMQRFRGFVLGGPYYHEGQNLCWLCDTGIDTEETHPVLAGHELSCPYLVAWLVVKG